MGRRATFNSSYEIFLFATKMHVKSINLFLWSILNSFIKNLVKAKNGNIYPKYHLVTKHILWQSSAKSQISPLAQSYGMLPQIDFSAVTAVTAVEAFEHHRARKADLYINFEKNESVESNC